MRRIWVESLPPQELGGSAARRLLAKWGVPPLIALPPNLEPAAMLEAMRALAQENLPFGIWPLLTDQDGYWPGERNAPAFAKRAQNALTFTRRAAAPKTLAVDLEPPLEKM